MQFTTFCPRFSHPISVFIVFSLPKTSSINRNQTPNNRKTHRNSPQTPKTCFIHSEVVHPPLLTLPSPGITPERKLRGKWIVGPKKKAPSSKGWGLRICRRSPNLPHTYACSTIGPTRLNFRVRDGNGCDPRGKLTGKFLKSRSRDLPQLNRLGVDVSTFRSST